MPNHYRISKTVDGTKTYQLWDNDRVVSEFDSELNLKINYRIGTNGQVLSDSKENLYSYDGHGNLVNGKDNSSTTVYDAYGNKTEDIGIGDAPFGYCGEYTDSESGFVYLRNRYYDPSTGSFITEDPIKDGNNFEINRSIVYNGKDINFHMPSMSACIKHYEIGFQISGSHHVYSTDGEWDILRGYVGTIPLGLQHQTFYTSNETHNSILIKYSFDIADYIKSEISAVAFNRFYAEKYHILNQEDQQVVRNIFEKMLTEYNINSPYSDSKLKALLIYLIIFIIEHELSHDINGSQGKKINKNINNVMRYIDSNYMTDINVDNICKLFSFSSSHFSRLFKQNTGEAFSRYLSKVRLEHAIVLLSNTDKPIDEIAYECGFKSTSYFSYAFKKEFLVSPLKYRMQMKG